MTAGGKISWDGPDLRIDALRAAYRGHRLTPLDLVECLTYRLTAYDDPALWIARATKEELIDRATALGKVAPDSLPLYGIPFAVKDNIDVAGHPTTAGCPAFSRVAETSAPAVTRLIEAGAILIGKANLDQFATGLVGVRSPYGIPRNPVAPGCIPGGSSSGSAVAVAAGLVSFALGTDTAGSGRVPAAFNNIVGLKPTKGLISTRGIVPACRSLDCVSIFALSTADAVRVLTCIASFDPEDPYSRRQPDPAPAVPRTVAGTRFGVPNGDALTFFGDGEAAVIFGRTLERLRALGAIQVETDFGPFAEAAALLYDGPWVAERYAAVGDFIDSHPEAVHEVTRGVITAGRSVSASSLFAAQHRLAALSRRVEQIFGDIDVLITPTTPTIFTIADIEADPVRLNSRLGTYTNFVNLLDLAAIAVPAGFTASGRPAGITLVGPAWRDAALASLGGHLHHDTGIGAGAVNAPLPPPEQTVRPAGVGNTVHLAVNGAHMQGLSLNHQLRALGARFAFSSRTAPSYRMYVIDRLDPPRPGLVRAGAGGSIDVEVWEMPVEAFGAFVRDVPAPLGIGTVELHDGRQVKGFLCEAEAARDAVDITEFGGWRSYLTAAAPSPARAWGDP